MFRTRFLPLLIACVLLASGCSAGYYDTASETAASPSTESYREMRLEEAYDEYGYDDDMYEVAAVEEPNMGGGENITTGGGATEAIEQVSSDRKTISTFTLGMQTTTFDESVNQLDALVKKYGGYMEYSNVEGRSMYDTYGTRYANFTARIPMEGSESFLSEVGGIVHITYKQESVEDITDRYFDTQSRINSLVTQEERLTAMLEQAEDLEYLLQIETELSNIRYQLDYLTSAMSRMNNQVSMCYVSMNLEEVIEYDPVDPVPVTFGERAGRAFNDSIRYFVYFVQSFILTSIRLWPLLAFFLVLIIIVLVAVRRNKKRKAQATGGAAVYAIPPTEPEDGTQPEDPKKEE